MPFMSVIKSRESNGREHILPTWTVEVTEFNPQIVEAS